MDDRPVPTDEIEVTPEMIEAGEQVLLCELGGGVSSNWDPADLAARVFAAMVRSGAEQKLKPA